MKISCPSCEAKYSIGDEKVQDRLAKIRCRKCGADIVIDGRVQPPSVSLGDGSAGGDHHAVSAGATASAAAPQAPGEGPSEYTVDLGENDQRPMSLAQVIEAYNTGVVTAETYVWADGMTDWTPLSQVAAIVDALNAAASQPQASDSPMTADSIAQASAGTQGPAAAPAQSAGGGFGGRAATRGGTADLFGGIAHAGSEEDVTTSAPQDVAPAPGPATGARNESSVLFSLSALTASAKSTPTAAPPLMSMSSPAASLGRGADDDSGLIDLKALTSQAAAPAPTAEPMVSPLGGLGAPLGGLGAPLGGGGLGGGGLAGAGLGGGIGSPLGGLGSPLGGGLGGGGAPVGGLDMAYPKQKNRSALYIGGGLAVGLIAIALVMGLKKDPPPPVSAPPPAATPTPYRPPEEDKTAATDSQAKPPNTGAEAPSAAPSASTAPSKGGGSTWRPPRRPTGGTTTPKDPVKPAGDTPKPPKPAGNPCGCAASDLNCAMRCSTRGK